MNFSLQKIVLTHIHQYLLNIYGEQKVDVSTVKWWVMCFTGGDSDARGNQHSQQLCTIVHPQNEKHLDQLIWANHHIMIKVLYTKLNISFNALKMIQVTLGNHNIYAKQTQ